MLKKTLISYENVNIADFSKVSSFLKTKSLGYVPKKSADLNRAEVETFLKEAPNEEFLLVKVRYCIALSIILILKLKYCRL
jgi:hypothetical protein